MTIFTLFTLWFQILNLPAFLQNKNTRLGPFPWKIPTEKEPIRANQSARISLRLVLPYDFLIFLSLLVHVEIVAHFKEELVKRCQILVVIAKSNSNNN